MNKQSDDFIDHDAVRQAIQRKLEAAAAPDAELLTLRKKSEELGISLSHLRRLVDAGRVPIVDLTLPGSRRRTIRLRSNRFSPIGRDVNRNEAMLPAETPRNLDGFERAVRATAGGPMSRARKIIDALNLAGLGRPGVYRGLYCVQVNGVEGPVKIGRAANTYERWLGLVHSWPAILPMSALCLIADAARYERPLQRLLAPWWLYGEWYSPDKRWMRRVAELKTKDDVAFLVKNVGGL